jgi:hypothetical protein
MEYNVVYLHRNHKHRGVEQLVAHRAHNPRVVGSSPASATYYIKKRQSLINFSGWRFYLKKISVIDFFYAFAICSFSKI